MRGAICKRFSANAPPGALRIFVLISVVLRGRVLVFGARERSERVTTRRQPPRQRSRRTCIKTSTRPIVTYLPYLGLFPRFPFAVNMKKRRSKASVSVLIFIKLFEPKFIIWGYDFLYIRSSECQVPYCTTFIFVSVFH